MECAEIRNLFVAGRVPAGPDVEAHVQVCSHCGELFADDAQLGRRLADAVLPEMEAGDLFALIDRDVQQEVGLRARLRALPTRVRAGALLGVVVALLLFELSLRRRDFSAYSPAVFWAVVLAFAAAFFVGVLRLTRGASAPLGAEGRGRAVALALLVAPVLASLIVPLGSGTPEAAVAWGNPAACFAYGAALVAPFLLLFWLFERRDKVPVTALVSAGGLAGIAANLLLHAHCPSAHLGHLLLGHASIGLVWALALGLATRRVQRST